MSQYFSWFYKPQTKGALARLLMAAIFSAVSMNPCKAQNLPKNINPVLQSDSVYFKVDEQPAFPGGAEAFVKFFSKNINYSPLMKKLQIQGKVIVQFIVEKDGSVTNVKAIKGPGSGTSEEAVRVMQKSPQWKPGIKDNKPVRVQYAAPIIFAFKAEELKNDDGPLTLHNN